MDDRRSCPICRSESLQRVLRDVTFSAALGSAIKPLPGVTSYRCPKGHVFMILPTETVAQQRICDTPIFLLNVTPHR